MIFGPDLAQQARNGTKTMIRIAAQRSTAVAPFNPCPFRQGHHYGIQAAQGKRSNGQVEVLHVIRQTLQDVTETDLHAEGFISLEEFRDDYRQRHQIPDTEPTPWDTPVWAITFKTLDEHTYLANQTTQADYTSDLSRAAQGEPEAVHPEDVARTSARFASEHQWRRERQLAQAAIAHLSLTQKLALLKESSSPLAARDLRSIDKIASSALRKLGEAA